MLCRWLSVLSEPVRAPEPWWAAAGQQAAAQPCTPDAFPALPHAGPASEHSELRQVPIICEVIAIKSASLISIRATRVCDFKTNITFSKYIFKDDINVKKWRKIFCMLFIFIFKVIGNYLIYFHGDLL
jgi:hypothetical protein